MSISAVITADIVNSTILLPEVNKKLRTRLVHVLNPHKSEFFRGDSFQVFIRDAHDALKTIFQIRGEARKLSPELDIRASIGIGTVNPYLKKLSTSVDEAFVLSGRALDTLGKDGARLTIVSGDEKANLGFTAIASFADYILKELTEKQAEVLVELLQGNTQVEVAKKLKKSQSTIHKHAHSTGWPELLKLLDVYKSIVSTISV